MPAEPWYGCGLRFGCTQCGQCCSGPGEGYIWVTQQEIKLIAAELNLTVGEMRSRYLRRVGWRTTIIEDPVSHDCIFLQPTMKGKGCSIYRVRPTQCRTWPFWDMNLVSPDAWNEACRRCPGVNRGKLHDLEAIEKARTMKKWWGNDDESG